MGKKDRTFLKNLSLFTYIGVSMVVPILGCVYLGHMADERFQTGNVFLIVFVILGVLTAFVNAYKVIMKTMDKK